MRDKEAILKDSTQMKEVSEGSTNDHESAEELYVKIQVLEEILSLENFLYSNLTDHQ